MHKLFGKRLTDAPRLHLYPSWKMGSLDSHMCPTCRLALMILPD